MTEKKDITVCHGVRVKRSKIKAMAKKYGNFNKAVNALIDKEMKK